jgi:hypothetical protein
MCVLYVGRSEQIPTESKQCMTRTQGRTTGRYMPNHLVKVDRETMSSHIISSCAWTRFIAPSHNLVKCSSSSPLVLLAFSEQFYRILRRFMLIHCIYSTQYLIGYIIHGFLHSPRSTPNIIQCAKDGLKVDARLFTNYASYGAVDYALPRMPEVGRN